MSRLIIVVSFLLSLLLCKEKELKGVIQEQGIIKANGSKFYIKNKDIQFIGNLGLDLNILYTFR